ncbi:MAG TPA: hypothetical protein VKC35_06205, partial [Vicinamibacterales bacterium]|nr:hypothetical protein [Vicinamibacterales bacterium]
MISRRTHDDRELASRVREALDEIGRSAANELLVEFGELTGRYNRSFAKYRRGLTQCGLDSVRRFEERER